MYAIVLQNEGGSFVLKMFDFFHKPTIDILYFLCSLYDSVNIIKPCTSRNANSEKYIVCQGFRGFKHPDWFSFIESAFIKAIEIDSNNYSSILNIDIPLYFYNKVEDMNSIYGQIQIDNISNTLALMDSPLKNDKMTAYGKINQQKCIYWCMKYGYDHYRLSKSFDLDNCSDSSDEFTRGSFIDKNSFSDTQL